MSKAMPDSPAAVSLALGEERAREPLASIDELDNDDIAALVRTQIKYTRFIGRATGLPPSLALTSWFAANWLGLLPPDFQDVGLLPLLGLSCFGSWAFVFAQRRHWRRECAAVGLSTAQSKELHSRLQETVGALSRHVRWGVSVEKRVQESVDRFAAGRQNQLPPSDDGRG